LIYKNKVVKKFNLAFIGFLICMSALSQDLSKFHLYDPKENAAEGIREAVAQAKKQGKHVFVQVGGNWCIWCARFNDFITNDPHVDSIIRAGYVIYHLNYSQENHNGDLLARYGFPQRFGFPVFLVLAGDGRLLHTQSSWYLEDGKKSYDRDKVSEFFTDWTPQALDPAQYKDQ
jgi:thiol:disulfide interchange protein